MEACDRTVVGAPFIRSSSSKVIMQRKGLVEDFAKFYLRLNFVIATVFFSFFPRCK